ITAEKENTLVYLSAIEESIERLDPSATDTLVFLFKAAHEQEDIGIRVKSISGFIIHESVEDERHTVDIKGCPIGKITGLGSAEDSEGCVKLTIVPAPVVVNSTGDDPLDTDLDEEDGCSTGGSVMRDGQSEPECTLRAALERVSMRTSTLAVKVEFDIPGDDQQHIIRLEESALPIISVPVEILGSTQPQGQISIDGSGLQVNGAALVIGGEASLVEGLALYGFNGTVIEMSGNESILQSSRIGTDWLDGHMSSDIQESLRFRNDGIAIRVTGNEVTIGGVGTEGNVI